MVAAIKFMIVYAVLTFIFMILIEYVSRKLIGDSNEKANVCFDNLYSSSKLMRLFVYLFWPFYLLFALYFIILKLFGKD